MRPLTLLLTALFAVGAHAAEPRITRDIPYAEPANPRQMLDVYAPAAGNDVPVILWIHGGGWRRGDKASVQLKPAAFVERARTVARSARMVDMGPLDHAMLRERRRWNEFAAGAVAELIGSPTL